MLPGDVDSTSDADAPLYSKEPALDERTLERTLPHFARAAPTGTYTRGDEHLRLALKAQADDAKVPSYGRHGLIHGEVTISEPDGITAVDLKLEGKLETALAGIKRPTSRFLKLTHSVWRAASADAGSSARHTCPAQLHFEMKLPATYRGGTRNELPLPPSCEIVLPDCAVVCKYTLTVSASQTPRLGFLKRQKTFTVDVDYRPEMLPPRPVVPLGMSFAATEASAPAAWHAVTSAVQPRYGSGLQPIQCHFYVPSTRTFGMAAPIPFHVRLTGPPASLRALCTPSAAPTASTRSCSSTSSDVVRVQLERHIHFNSHGEQAVRTQVQVGAGAVRALPPRSPGTDGVGEEMLEWEGHVRCTGDVGGGGFVVGDALLIKNYLVLSVCPPAAGASPLLDMQSRQYILLVDDRWSLGSGHA